MVTRRPPSRLRSIKRLRELDEAAGVLEPTDLRPRIDAGQEADLGPIDVARPGHHRLIDERVTHLAFGLGREPPGGLVGIPVRTEDVGAEVLEESLFGGRPDHLEPSQSMADRDPVLGLEHASDLEGASAPPFAGFVQPPRAVHAEVRVDRDCRRRCGRAGACRAETTSRTTCPEQIRGREARHAEVRSREHPTGERVVHARRRREHRVAFCHLDIIRDRGEMCEAGCVKPETAGYTGFWRPDRRR